MKKVRYSIGFTLALIISGMACDSDVPGLDEEPLGIDTLAFREVNTTKFLMCMWMDDIAQKKDSFMISTEDDLKENFEEEVGCWGFIPPIHFKDSVLIGYTTRIGGSGLDNDRILLYDRSNNSLRYSITAYSNDTSALNLDLNWIMVPDHDFDSISYHLKIEKQ